MRTVLITLVACVGLVYLIGGVVGIEPKDRRPGTRLAGEPAAIPQDWSTTESVDEVHLETHPWYGIPFSVTTVIARSGDALYVPSLYDEAAEFPGTKFWNRVVLADPMIRLRVGEKLYELRIDNVTTEAEFLEGVRALAQKYGFWQQQLAELAPAGERKFTILRLRPRAN